MTPTDERDPDPDRTVPDGYRQAVAALDPAVVVVTAADGSGPAGCLVSFAVECSIDPPRLLVMLSRPNRTYEVASRSSMLGVHVLGDDELDVASHFGEASGYDADKFAGVEWSYHHGVPLIAAGIAQVVGRITQTVPFGDHVGFVLAPVAAAHRRDRSPLRLDAVSHLEAGRPP